jgi:hypothetical protein
MIVMGVRDRDRVDPVQLLEPRPRDAAMDVQDSAAQDRIG